MTQEMTKNGENTKLETDIFYSGDKTISDNERFVRKAIKLPVTKRLVYYRNKYDASSVAFVSKFKIIEVYNLTYPWYTLELSLQNTEETVRIHSSFFSDMQDPKFVEKYRKQERENIET